MLLKAGADKNQVTHAKRETPALVAARAGEAAVVRRLGSAGADLGLGNRDGETPLHVATQLNLVPTVKGETEAKGRRGHPWTLD